MNVSPRDPENREDGQPAAHPDDRARRFLPLTHLGFHVLLSLAAGERHGYAIIREIEERSGGVVSPGTGSFYDVIRRMVADGLLREVTAPRRDRPRTHRRYYGITALGREVLRLEAMRIASLVKEANRLGVLGGPTT